MYPVTLVGSGADGGNIQQLTPTSWPAGIRAGDTAILLWSQQNTFTYSNLGGFSSVDTQVNGSLQVKLCLRVCDGTETGAVSVSSSGVNRQSCALAIYRGLDWANPVAAWTFAAESTARTAHPCPAVTTPDADCVIVSGVGERGTNGSTGWNTSWTERGDSGMSGWGTGGTITAIADDGLATARPTGADVTPPSWTSSSSFSTAIILTWSVALRRPSATGWGIPL